ncbi:hypothetical protein B0H10DRAFT_2088376 [Mycena sp. CBHHK59/15]|nr:hypothetical protein B0H10DRAFT_2088376 [Mycena sp. CBHHK59/15]
MGSRPPALRLDHLGIDPADLVGKVLTSVRRSPKHPSLTLVFADGDKVQVMVDGYDPVHRGVPKALEMDSDLDALVAARPARLTVAACALITLSDKAFAAREGDSWDQRHLGLALRFATAGAHDAAEPWHCVWATLQDHDAATGECVFRTYDDVYLEKLPRSPRKSKHCRSSHSSEPSPS